MLHGLSNDLLYTAVQLKTTFCDRNGRPKDTPVCGSGFLIQNSREQLCLITNRHVVDLGYSDNKYIGYSLTSLIIKGKRKAENSQTLQVDQEAEISVDPNKFQFSEMDENDIACLINPLIINDSVFRSDYFIRYSFIANKDQISNQLIICDFVAFPGYHPEYDKFSSRPILRTGTISSDPRFNYSYNGQDCGECIAFEAFSYGGASGSPVFAVQKGPRPGKNISFPSFREVMMIGINAGHIRGDYGMHSGISYMYKSSAILDIVDR